MNNQPSPDIKKEITDKSKKEIIGKSFHEVHSEPNKLNTQLILKGKTPVFLAPIDYENINIAEEEAKQAISGLKIPPEQKISFAQSDLGFFSKTKANEAEKPAHDPNQTPNQTKGPGQI